MGKPIPRLAPPPNLSVDSIVHKVLAAFAQHECDVLQLSFTFPFSVFCLRDPEHIRLITTNERSATVKPPHTIPKADWMMGNGVYNDLGHASWKAKRRELNPAFAERHSASLCELLPASLDRMAARWRSFKRETPVDLYAECLRLVMDYSAYSLFSRRLSDADLDWITQEVAFTEDMFVTLTPIWIPTSSNLKFRKVGARFKQFMDETLRQRRAMTETHADLLHFLMLPDEKTGLPKSDKDIKAAMFSVFFGTTALALPILWSLYFLSDRPEMLQRLRDELQSVIGSRAPTREELKQLPYLGCFTKEVLRIYPPFWGSLRYSSVPLELDGYTFPARSIFAMIRIATHHHPDYWQDPEAFMPERFQADQAQRGVREAYLPFGLGPRLCLGRHLANMMVPIIVAALVGQFDVDITSPKPARLRYTFGVHPRAKIMASIQRRS